MAQNLRVGILLSMGVRGMGEFRKVGGGLKGLQAAAKKVRVEFALLAAQEAFAFMSDALQTFAQFDHSMKKVQAVTAATGAELEELTNVARQLGRDFPFTASEAADAMFELSLAGLKVNEVLQTTETVLKLAMAGNMGLAQSARIAVATMNAFGMEAEEVTHIGDQLTAAFTNSAMTLAEVGAGLSFVGPVAKLANVSLSDSVTTLGMFANAGIVGARSGTTFRQMLSKMLDPTTDAQQRMNELGLSFVDASGQMLPMIDIVKQLIDAQLTANDVITIFGIRAAPGVGALINQGVEGFEELSGAVVDSEGRLADIADTMESSAQNEFKKFTSAMEDFKIQVGFQLMPIVNELIGLFRGENGLGVALTNLVVAFADILLVIAQMVAVMQPLITVLGDATGWLARHSDILEIVITLYVAYRAKAWAASIANMYMAATTALAARSQLTLAGSLAVTAKWLGIIILLYVMWEGVIFAVVSAIALLLSLLGKAVNSLTQLVGIETNLFGAGSYNKGPSIMEYTRGATPGTFNDAFSDDSIRERIGFETGGLVQKTGWYQLHAGELVKRRQALTTSDYEEDSGSVSNYNLTVNAMSTTPFSIGETVGKELKRFNLMVGDR